jgi:hypothetical protein
MAAAGGWPVASKVTGLLGVVIDQQPPLPPTQLVPELGELCLLVAQLGQAQAHGQRGQSTGNGQRPLGRHPPDQVVVGRIPVGVVDSQLGLAHPTEAVNRAGLHHRPRLLGLEQVPKGLEQFPTAGEVRIAGGNAEYLRQPTRIPRAPAGVVWTGNGRLPGGLARPCSIPARSRAAAAGSSRPTRSTYTRPAKSPGGWQSCTRTGTSNPNSPVGSLAKAARHSASPNLEPK